ncbi:hypothetical protein ONE63_006922 [Megalurothrips usitatus]|uniref:CXXC motif containing zinc binding protein n=1 Tax=Megalurothrips usitatus TaxID=439358 RepID=A0AAV7XQE7_9NEOP|nr:hypothetical protein ONE63_006922 [Megalurothrips usitatus]
MVKLALQMKAQFENVEAVYTPQPEFRYFLKIRCSGCNEESDKWHDVSLSETVALKTGRGNANFAFKCKLCGKDNQMDVLEKSVRKEGWVVEASEGGQKFEEVDLTDGEWVDYDEKLKETVRVFELEFKFIKSK